MIRKESNIYIIQFRPLDITSLTFARRERKEKQSSLELLDSYGLVKQLEPEKEWDFVKTLVDTHPAHEKNFEHFLVSPPDNIKPTDILKALQKRTALIPTLCEVHLQKGRIIQVEQIKAYYRLLGIISDAKDDGIIPSGGRLC